MEEYFYPPPDSQFPAWLANYTPKAIALAAIIGLTPDEVAKLIVINNALSFTAGRINAYDNALSEFIRTRQIILNGDLTNQMLEAVEFEDQPAVVVPPTAAPANIKAFIQNLVVRTRACPTLNEMKKKEMGVLPKPKSVPTLQAVLKGELVLGQPVLECKLYGYSVFEIWRKVTGTGDFVYLDFRVGNTYTDNTPLPPGLTAVQYDYKIRLLGDDNVPVTDYSNVVTLTKTA